MPNVPLETHKHLFYECRFVLELVEKYFLNFYGENIDTKELFFKGFNSDIKLEVNFINLEVSIFLYCLHDFKLRKKLPHFGSLTCAIAIMKKNIFNTSKVYRRWVEWVRKNRVGSVLNHLDLMEKMPIVL